MPVMISRSGRCPWRTRRRAPASVLRSACRCRKSPTSASTAFVSRARAPLRKISVSESVKVPGCASLKTLVSTMAYHSFGGEVEALNTPTIRRLTPSCRHQLSRIARKVALIAHDAMKQLIHRHPGIGDAFWRDTLIDAAIFREWIVNVGSREAYSRIAHLLCEIFLKLKAVGLTNGTSFEFPITQSKIGEATGLSTVHVNRSVQALRADGVIVLERGRCTISDLERLKEAAMFDPTYLHLRGEQRVAA